MIRFTVYGKPQPAGSKKSFVPLNKITKQPYRRAGGGVVVSTIDDNAKAKPWQAEVKYAAREAYSGPLLEGPLKVRMVFYRQRPASHVGTKHGQLYLKAKAPEFPTTKPDVLKLARAIEDSLTGQIYRDDSQIVVEILEKKYDTPERVEVEIEPHTAAGG